MDRNEAVTCLKEITAICTSLSPDSVSLFNSKSDDSFSVGYQVHIKVVLDKEVKQQIQDIAKKHDLVLKQENGKVIIYQPKISH